MNPKHPVSVMIPNQRIGLLCLGFPFAMRLSKNRLRILSQSPCDCYISPATEFTKFLSWAVLVLHHLTRQSTAKMMNFTAKHCHSTGAQISTPYHLAIEFMAD